jgi:hypothetical protein
MFTTRVTGVCLALALLSVLTQPAGAWSWTDANWIGGNGYWDDPTHWNIGVVPDNVFHQYSCLLGSPGVTTAVRQDVTVSMATCYGDLRLVNGATFTLEEYLSVKSGSWVYGRGVIQSLLIDNYGDIFASGYGNSLTVVSGDIENWGAIGALNNGKLTLIDAAIWAPTGNQRVYADSSGTIVLQNCRNYAGLEVDGNNAQAVLVNSTVAVRDLIVLGNGKLRVTGGTSEVDYLNIVDNGEVRVDANATFIVHNTYMGSGGSVTYVYGTVAFDPNGATLDRAPLSLQGGAVTGAVTMTNTTWIDGNGTVSGSVYMESGTQICAYAGGQSLTLTGGFGGNGAIWAANAGRLTIQDAWIAFDANDVNARVGVYNGGTAEVRSSTILAPVDVLGGVMNVYGSDFTMGDSRPVVTISSDSNHTYWGSVIIREGTCHIAEADVMTYGELKVASGARLLLDTLHLAPEHPFIDGGLFIQGSFTVEGTVVCDSGRWYGSSQGSAQLTLAGGRIEGSFINDLAIVGYGQIASPASEGYLVQNNNVTVTGGVLELTPGTQVETAGNWYVDRGSRLFLNNSRLRGYGNQSLGVEGTLRLDNATIGGMYVSIRIGGYGYEANMVCTGENDLTDEWTRVYFDNGAKADIQSGTTRIGWLETEGQVDVRSGAVLRMESTSGNWRLSNYGTMNVFGALDCNTSMGEWRNYGTLNVAPSGSLTVGDAYGTLYVENYGEVNIAPGGRAEFRRTEIQGEGVFRVGGLLNLIDCSYFGTPPQGIVLEGGTVSGKLATGGSISGYGTLAGNFSVSGGSVYSEVNGQTLTIRNTSLEIDGDSGAQLRADYGGKISIENSLVNIVASNGGGGGGGGAMFVVQNQAFDSWDPPPPPFSVMMIRDSGVVMDGLVGKGGMLITLGAVELGNVDVVDGMMVVLGNTGMGRLLVVRTDPGHETGGSVFVGSGHALTLSDLYGMGAGGGGVDVDGELHFRSWDETTPSMIGGGGGTKIHLSGGRITGDNQVILLGGDLGADPNRHDIDGFGQISAPLENHGKIVAEYTGGWLRLNTTDKVNYGRIEAHTPWNDGNRMPQGGTLAVEGIRLDNYGQIYIDPNSHLLVDGGVIDSKDPNSTCYTMVDGTYELRRGGSILGNFYAPPGSGGIIGAGGQGSAGVNTNRFALGNVHLAGRLDVMNPADGGAGSADANDTIVTAASVNVHSGGDLRLLKGGHKRLVTAALAVDCNNSRLDLTDNGMIVKYGGGASPLDAITAMIASGHGAGDWRGFGVTSSTVDGNYQAVGVVDNATLGYTEFLNLPVDANTVLVKPTWGGDADLDGDVTGLDYGHIDFAYATNNPESGPPPDVLITGWQNGDFDYDGAITGLDYGFIDFVYATLHPESGGVSGAASAAPEPTTVALLALGGLAATRRRSRGGHQATS